MTTASLPAAPYFVVSQTRRGMELQRELEHQVNTNRLALITNWDEEWCVYDANGFVWRRRFKRPSRRFSVLARVLAHTLYNPVQTAETDWDPIRRYPLDELQHLILVALENDDDTLTQFVNRDELVDRIQACCTFADIVATWNSVERQ